MSTAIRSISAIFLILFLFLGCSLEEIASIGSENNLSLGASARDLLSDEKHTSLHLEIVYVSGLEPSAETINELQSFLHKHTNKPNGISISKREIPSPGIISYKTSDLLEVEKQVRRKFNAGNEISVFILLTDGKSEGHQASKMLLGTAYRNTSMVIFKEVIQDLALKSYGVTVNDIETTALKHEFGHLFGLVGNGSPVQTKHEDGENKSHCNVSYCLMAASVQFTSTENMAAMKSQETFSFDPSCLADLRANGGR